MATATIADALGPIIPEWQLGRRLLPVKPDVPELTGRFVVLKPFDADAHLPALVSALNGDAYCGHPKYDALSLIWKYMRGFNAGGVVTDSTLREYFVRIRDIADARMFVVVESEFHRIIGMTALLANRPSDLVVEVGAISFTPAFQATPANTEATALLCRWAFEQGYRRVEWKCNSQNERSKAAALRIGFTFEGIFRNHMVVAGNRSRDTAWYAIIDSDWPEKSRALTEWLSSDAPVALYARRKATLSSMSIV